MDSPLGSAPSIMVGVGVGNAASAALGPLVEPGRQQAWYDHPNRVLDPGLMARLAAQGAVSLGVGRAQARREGFSEDKFDRLVYLAQHVPEWAQVRELINRKLISADQRDDALSRHAYPADWRQPLIELMQDILSPGELAAAIHRGLVPDPGLLKGEQPAPPFRVEAYPVYPIDAVAEAEGSGYDRDRLGVLVGLQGLPMGTHEAAQAYFRGIITHGDYVRAFNESNSRNEWAQAVLDQTRQIPTARDFMENALRGYHDLKWAQQQAARHGMSPEDTLVIYQNQGRPMNIHQITQALARGAEFNPEPGEITDPYLASIVEGPLKPAYYELAESLKYTLPSTFAMRQLAESGVWSEAKTAERLRWAGWFPPDADEAAKAWAGGGGTTTDPYLSKARTTAWTKAQASYLAREATASDVAPIFTTLGVPAAAQTEILTLWDQVRGLIHAQLSPKEVVKAVKNQVTNPATGVPWTFADGLQALMDRGYTRDDATTLLNE